MKCFFLDENMRFFGMGERVTMDIPTIKRNFSALPYYTATTLIVGGLSLCAMAKGVVMTGAAVSTATSITAIAPGALLVLAGAYCALNASRNLMWFKGEQMQGRVFNFMQWNHKDPLSQIINALLLITTCQTYSLRHIRDWLNR